MVVHTRVWWVPRGVVAICVGRHVFTALSSLPQYVLDHEEEHVRQYAQYGIVGYLVRWFYWTWRVGYVNNPFEIEAQRFADEQRATRLAERGGSGLQVRGVVVDAASSKGSVQRGEASETPPPITGRFCSQCEVLMTEYAFGYHCPQCHRSAAKVKA